MERTARINYDVEDGCDYHPHCLSCPLTVCRYDVRNGIGEALRLTEQMAERRRLSAQVSDTGPHVIVQMVALAHGLPVKVLTGKSRASHIVAARDEAALKLREAYPEMPYKAIGYHLGGRDHSTVIHIFKKHDPNWRKYNRRNGTCTSNGTVG